MAFTPEDREQIKAYLGYPTLTQAQLLDHGILPAGGTEMLFIIEANLEKVPPAAEPLVRAQMARIACVVQQIQQSYGSQIVGSAGGVTFNGMAAIISTNYAYTLETDKLSDLLHAPIAPTSSLHARIGGSGVGAVIEPY